MAGDVEDDRELELKSLEFVGRGQMEDICLQPYPCLPLVAGDMCTAEAFHTTGRPSGTIVK